MISTAFLAIIAPGEKIARTPLQALEVGWEIEEIVGHMLGLVQAIQSQISLVLYITDLTLVKKHFAILLSNFLNH